MAGLAVLIVLISLNQLRQAPSVEAASILRTAVRISESKPHVAHRVRVRTSHQQEFTRLAVMPAALQVGEAQAAEAPTVGALFAEAHYDWNDPLSARAFQQWRDEQVHETDEVSTSGSVTRIRTVAAEGELAAATITIAADYSAVEERLEFRDREWVELSEIAEMSTERAGGTLAAPVDTPVRAAEPPSRPAAFTPGGSASMADELQVLSALNAIGADLGEHVEVALSGGAVMVTGGDGIPPQRQQVIRDAVASLPHVQVDFTPAERAAVPPESVAANGGSTVAPISAIQTRLQKQLGGHAEFDRFSSQLLDLDDGAMQRVYALRRLAQKFSPEDEAQLSSPDLSILRELTRTHAGKLAEKVGAMERLMVPVLTSLGGTAASVPEAGAKSWQPASEDVYRDARRVEVLVSQMLAMTPDNASGSSNALPSELLTALKELHAHLDECQKFLQTR
jgi:hypothetical protein